MAVLVTGGLGHVGSWISRKLVKQGEEVIIGDVIVNKFKSLGYDYLEEIEDELIFENLDVLSFANISEVFNKHRDKITGVIHTVAHDPGVAPYKGITLNTFGTLNVIEACRIFEIDKFVFISSGAVYGDTPGPLKEETPYKPTDYYGASKVSSEQIVLQYGNRYNIDVRCPRIYFVYGPGKLPSRMNGLHRGLFGPLAGERDLSFSKGRDTYADFTFVEDAAEGVIKAYQTKNIKNRIFNISSGIAVGVEEIMIVIKDLVGEDPNINFGEGPWLERGAPLDISRARNELDFNPQYTDIKTGIELYYKWTQKAINSMS